jgi:8-oxo-dGTP pyrophosphatase MutT (NUDIX family)
MPESSIAAQIAALSQQYGAPLRHTADLAANGLFDPLRKTDRYGEVCMVVRRPNGRLITARKTFYPAGAFRLLTGGISHGESILDALLRETAEETGLDTAVRRFLAAIEYRVIAQDDSQVGAFYTFALLLDEIGGTLQCADPHERLDEFREITIDDLPRIADQLDSLGQGFDPEINGRWRDWGRFRAVIHRVVYESLRDNS